MSADDGPGTREIARRLFAAEYEDTSLSYSESDEERAPNYVVTPTGARINRMFVVGVLTEVESVNEEMVRARLVDPSGAFVAYAGQYQPEALAFFERHEPPAFVALSGKARTFRPEDSERVFTSIRPESVNSVDADTRDRWVVSAAEATLRRVSQFEAALDSGLSGEALTEALADRGVDESLAAGIPRAMGHYGTTRAYLEAVRRLAVDALEVVAGEREEVRPLDAAPDEGGEAAVGPIPDRLSATPIEAGAAAGESATTPGADSATPEESDTSVDEPASEPVSATDPTTGATASGSAAEFGDDPTESETEQEAEPQAESSEPEPASEPADTESEELGDFDAGGGGEASEAEQSADEPAEDADSDESEMYELDEEERREVEAEFDVGFESGADVDGPGEAGIETPDPEELAAAEAEAEEETDAEPSEPSPEPDGAAGVESEAESDAQTAAEPDMETETDAETEPDTGTEVEEAAADVDLEDAAVEAMAELDDGDGADRDEVVAVVVDEYGADPGAVEDAIQEALMDGQCYEPGDGRLKAI